jgi:hypothetical protein
MSIKASPSFALTGLPNRTPLASKYQISHFQTSPPCRKHAIYLPCVVAQNGTDDGRKGSEAVQRASLRARRYLLPDLDLVFLNRKSATSRRTAPSSRTKRAPLSNHAAGCFMEPVRSLSHATVAVRWTFSPELQAGSVQQRSTTIIPGMAIELMARCFPCNVFHSSRIITLFPAITCCTNMHWQ